MGIDAAAPRSRRALLAAGLGGIGAFALRSLGRPDQVAAADGDPTLLGQPNTATNTTEIDTSVGNGLTASTSAAAGIGVQALNTADGVALQAVSGAAALGTASKIGVYGYANQDANARGVYGKTGQGTGVWGNSDTGRGVFGQTVGGQGVDAVAATGTAVRAKSTSGKAVDATTGSTTKSAITARTTATSVSAVQAFAGAGTVPAPTAETAVEGLSNTSTGSNGVLGRSAAGTGVWGDSVSGTGVFGSGFYGLYGTGVAGVVGDVDNGTGVQGWTGAAFAPTPVAAVGVWAGAESGRTALQVSGVAKFSRSGKVTIASGQSHVVVTVAGGITSAAFGLANLQANRAGTYVQAVVPSTAGTITIYLNKAVTASTTCAWMVVG